MCLQTTKQQHGQKAGKPHENLSINTRGSERGDQKGKGCELALPCITDPNPSYDPPIFTRLCVHNLGGV